jgi:acetyl/propionyl-CoA carboxylase alpha subunit
MIEANVNKNSYSIELDKDSESKGEINSELFDFEIESENEDNFKIRMQDKNYDLDIISVNEENKNIEVLVNGKLFNITLKDQYDKLISSLGLGKKNNNNEKNIKAPMPGLVIKLLVKQNEEIIEGQHLLVLEAMKMENIIKANSSGKLKSININIGDAVEKNEVLLEVE